MNLVVYYNRCILIAAQSAFAVFRNSFRLLKYSIKNARKTAAKDAITIDTSSMTISEQVQKVIDIIKDF